MVGKTVDRIKGQATVGAGRDAYHILPIRPDEDQGHPRGDTWDHPRVGHVDPFGPIAVEGGVAVGIVADGGHEDDRRAGPACGHGLVRTLPAGAGQESPPEDRPARTGEFGEAESQIGITRSKNEDARHGRTGRQR